ncbi:hypothetical protein [Kineosporia succinea]
MAARSRRGPASRAQGRDDLADAVDRAAFGRPVEHELSALAALLDDDETVQQVVEGGTGVAVLTTRRILVKVEGIDPALIIERADVIRAAGRTHRGMGTLTLKTRSGNLVVDQILGHPGRDLRRQRHRTGARGRPGRPDRGARRSAGATGPARSATTSSRPGNVSWSKRSDSFRSPS